MLADQVDYVVGVDTHRDEHVLAVVVASTGAVVAQRSVATTRAATGRRCGSLPSTRRPACVGGRGQLATTVPGLPVTSAAAARRCSRPAAAPRRAAAAGQGRRLDATRAARAALASETLALPRAGQRREALRLLLVARRSAVDVRREALDAAAQRDRDRPRRAPPGAARAAVGRLLERCSRLRRSSSRSPDELATTARAAQPRPPDPSRDRGSRRAQREILAHVRALAPRLLDEPGVGPIVAAQLIVSWSHHGRVRSEAAFARLAGVAPIPASAARRPDTGSAAAATANSTAPSTPSSSTAANTTPPPRLHRPTRSPKAKPAATPPGSSSATSPATSTASLERASHS